MTDTIATRYEVRRRGAPHAATVVLTGTAAEVAEAEDELRATWDEVSMLEPGPWAAGFEAIIDAPAEELDDDAWLGHLRDLQERLRRLHARGELTTDDLEYGLAALDRRLRAAGVDPAPR